MSNLKEVAKAAGVSPSTVSRALTDHPRISKATKTRIKKLAKELGYVPSKTVRSFNLKKSFCIGLVLTHREEFEFVSHEFISKLLQGVLEAANALEYKVVILTQKDFNTAKLENMVRSHELDGLIFPAPIVGDQRFALLYNRQIPFIFTHFFVKNRPYLYVGCDAEPGMKEAFDYIAQKNIKRVSFLTGPKTHLDAKLRKTLFTQLVKSHKMTICHIVEGDFTRDGGMVAAKAFLEGTRPEVIFCANDIMAFGLIESFKTYRIQVPNDIRIIGFDDSDLARYASPTLTTIENPLFEIGKLASRKLIAFIEGDEVKGEDLPSRLILRESA